MFGLLLAPTHAFAVLFHALAATQPQKHQFRTRFVLCETHHPGNVGAAARAMKTMGFEGDQGLWLVQPRDAKVLNRARTKDAASGALDVLQDAEIVDTLAEALKGCQVCCGTGMPVDMRQERPHQVYVEPRHFLEELVEVKNSPFHDERLVQADTDDATTTTIAFVFGNERVGLSEHDFALCNVILGIPTNPEFGSLNLASAVQLIAYDWRIALGGFLPDHNDNVDDMQQTESPPPMADTTTSVTHVDDEATTVVVDETGARSVFGTKEYWDEQYQGRGDFPADCYSWYFGWEVVGKTIAKYVPDKNARILVPGVGNDPVLLDLYKAGYPNLLGQDYSEHAVERQQELLSFEFIDTVPVLQGDVTNLPKSWENSFDIILEKGCLDAVYLSGEGNVEAAVENLSRVLKPNGRLISFSGVVPHELRQQMFASSQWSWLEDTSDDLKAGCFVLEKLGKAAFVSRNAEADEQMAAKTMR